jgi:polyhydroxybutyrate depolymerase
MALRRSRILLVVVLAILLLLCTVAAGVYWGTGPSLRCKLPTRGPARPGWSARTVLSGGQERCYHLYVPPGYEPARPAPLVLSLHGFLSNPDSQAWISGWHELADREGFLVVYPQGAAFPQRWNAGATWGTAAVDDVQFFRDLLADLSAVPTAVAAVDPARVYVNGFSNGGGMTVRFACEAAGQIAAIGTVAAAVVDMPQCTPSRPVPAMAFHGTADPIVPYGAEEWVATWARGNGCDPLPAAIPPQGDVRGIRYTGCDQGAKVILYTIEGGGHTWPGGAPIPGLGKASRDIDATGEMWRFFQAYRLDSQP